MRALGAAILGAVLAVVISAATAHATMMGYDISTLAGTGTVGSVGDGASARNASLNSPAGLAVAGDGSVLVAEYGGNRVRRIAPDGMISTVAGTGDTGSTGDAGPAADAHIEGPTDVAVHGTSIYVSQPNSGTIRRFVIGGMIETVVSGEDGPYGIDVASNGDLNFANSTGRVVRKVTAGVDGIADAGDAVETVAGTGVNGSTGDGGPALSASFGRPRDVAVRSDGSFAVTDDSTRKLRVVDGTGTITLLAGAGSCTSSGANAQNICGDGGWATLALLAAPLFVVSGPGGEWTFTDSPLHRVRQVSTGGIISTFVGTGAVCIATTLCGDGSAAGLATMSSPEGLVYNAAGTSLYVAADNRIRVVRPRPVNTGSVGPAGGIGAVGDDGDDGTPGTNGAAGNAGTVGANGAPGPDGNAGQPGALGAGGADGAAGKSGVAGVAGDPGAAGTNGANGTDAPFGMTLPLLAVLPDSRMRRTARKRVRFSAFVSGPADVTLTASRGRETRRAAVRSSGAARVTLTLGQLRRGTYRLTLRARRGNAQFVDRGWLVVR